MKVLTGLKPGDAVIAFLILSGSVFSFLLLPHRPIGKKCLVLMNGRPFERLDISRPGTALDTLWGASGRLILEYGNSKVRILDAACPNHACMKQGWILRSNESIVCVPNRCTVVIPAQSEAADAITE